MGLTSTHPLVAGSRPIVVSHFVSRDEMARLKDALDPAGVVTVCALQGQRGTGKSQLAAKYADECAASTTVEWSFVLWVAAPNRTAAIDGLAEIAKTAGIVELDAEPEFAAKRLVARLNTTGPNGDDYRLLVFDNVENMSDLDGLLPGGPRTRVVVTTTQSVTTTGVPVEVGVYTAEQAVQFLVEVTGLPDPEGAALLAKDLGRLPVALTQAAEVINGRGHSTFAVYADALAGADELSSVMQHPEGDPYGLTVDKALRMGYQDAVDACTRKAPEQGQAALAVLQALSVLAESGVPRVWLSVLGEDGDVVQDVVSELVARHVVEKAADGSQVYLHGLKSRVIGEDSPGEDVVRAAIAVLAGVNVLNDTCDYMDKRAMIAALGAQLLAVHTQTGSSSLLDEPDLLAVASRAIYVANELQDPYTPISLSMFLADMERVLGSDHPSTLASRNNLAGAYESAGRLGEAISLFEAALVDRERVLGSDHPDT
ncbi:MAG: tetratricopeptide repeat protein, partial [Propionibacteriaceae bacterium]|nr:tetratricopeptide repeat protein [Propionibacteriaceae bacterium]